jgi:4-hydroxy-3-methylbut-2-en-1-yl diphosphate synthase IspG/GcpE
LSCNDVLVRYDIPLVADIHFQPKVAMLVADAFEKIRINPGNFADGAKKFDVINYEDEVRLSYHQVVYTPPHNSTLRPLEP